MAHINPDLSRPAQVAMPYTCRGAEGNFGRRSWF